MTASPAPRPGAGTDDGLRAAALIAVHDMAADWYCPFDPERARIDCPDCIADVVVEALRSKVRAFADQRAAEAVGEVAYLVERAQRHGYDLEPDDVAAALRAAPAAEGRP